MKFNPGRLKERVDIVRRKDKVNELSQRVQEFEAIRSVFADVVDIRGNKYYDAKKLVPEGVEGRVAYKGTLEDTVFQLIGGIRSGMGYCGCPTIEDLKERGKFVKISAASLRESHPHDIHITKEAPNYSTDDNK
mgnify:CR=1 FL=1